jgi:hypothetical protein
MERDMTYEQHGAAIQSAIDTLFAAVADARAAGHVVEMDVPQGGGTLNVRVYCDAESAAAKMQSWWNCRDDRHQRARRP